MEVWTIVVTGPLSSEEGAPPFLTVLLDGVVGSAGECVAASGVLEVRARAGAVIVGATAPDTVRARVTTGMVTGVFGVLAAAATVEVVAVMAVVEPLMAYATSVAVLR